MQIIPATTIEKLRAIRNCEYFLGLEEKILAGLLPGMILARYEKGEVVFWQDEPCQGLYFIQQGSVKLFKISPLGREFIVTTFEVGNTFNEVPVFDLGTNPLNVAALEETLIWIVDSQTIRSAMAQYPAMCQSVVLNLAKNLRTLVKIIEELSFYQVTHRLARLLSQMPAEQLGGEVGTRLTQDQLAARLGTVREVVTRALRELERSGAIKVDRRQIVIVDQTTLSQWAQGPI